MSDSEDRSESWSINKLYYEVKRDTMNMWIYKS